MGGMNAELKPQDKRRFNFLKDMVYARIDKGRPLTLFEIDKLMECGPLWCDLFELCSYMRHKVLTCQK